MDLAHLPIIDGALAITRVEPEASLLEASAVDGQRLEFWRERVRQTWSAGAGNWITRLGWCS